MAARSHPTLDYSRAAAKYLEEARWLARLPSAITTEESFLESMGSEPIVEHDVDLCGDCYKKVLMQQVARAMLLNHEFADATHRWEVRVEALWKAGKYYRLWQEELAAGRDPNAAFTARGWQP